MEREEIIRALRCAASPDEHDCEGCPYLSIETLSGEEVEIFGTAELKTCDVDQISMDAARLLEEDAK